MVNEVGLYIEFASSKETVSTDILCRHFTVDTTSASVVVWAGARMVRECNVFFLHG